MNTFINLKLFVGVMVSKIPRVSVFGYFPLIIINNNNI